MISFGHVLSHNKNIGPGFDFLRVFLATSIVLFHSATVTNQYYPLDDTPMWMVHYVLVPMFFALSGFLVSASACRLTLKNFLINRGLRIVPALAVDTVVCMLIIGPLFTVLPLSDYFVHHQFFSYSLNIIGWVHFNLPGVFEHLPFTRVNGSLWTVPFELACYAVISILIVTGVLRTRFFVLGVILAYILMSMTVSYLDIPNLIATPALKKGLQVCFLDYEAQSVTAFLCGIVAYQNRESIPYSRTLFVLCLTGLCLIACLLKQAQGEAPVMRLLLMPMIAYITLFIGLTNMPLPSFFKRGDYSYGIYLYHQPFLQIVVSLFPALALAPRYGFAFTFLAGLPFVVGVAYLSWNLVEKPTLALRKRASIAANGQSRIDSPVFPAASTWPRLIETDPAESPTDLVRS